MLHLPIDHAQRLLDGPVAAGLEALAQHVARARDTGERVAQLVREHREELVALVVRPARGVHLLQLRLQGLVGELELLVQRLQLVRPESIRLACVESGDQQAGELAVVGPHRQDPDVPAPRVRLTLVEPGRNALRSARALHLVQGPRERRTPGVPHDVFEIAANDQGTLTGEHGQSWLVGRDHGVVEAEQKPRHRESADDHLRVERGRHVGTHLRTHLGELGRSVVPGREEVKPKREHVILQ